MSEELTDKFEVIKKGGEFVEEIEPADKWLDFLTNPDNLQPGLPDLAIGFGHYGFMTIEVSFDKTKPSLHSLRLDMSSHSDYDVSYFRHSEKEANAVSTDNPHHLKNWIFGIFSQSELVRLDVPFLIPELPDLFHKVPKLGNVSLRKSRVTQLPPSFYKLTELHSLSINNAGFPEVPAALSELKSLQFLSFTQRCAPEVLGSLIGLAYLDCACPNFDVPEEITELKNLKSLNLSSVGSASDGFFNFPNLEKLNFKVSNRSAMFNIMPGDVPCLKELTTNHAGAFARALASCKNLENFNISGTVNESEIGLLTKSLGQLGELKELQLPDFGITDMQFCKALAKLQRLDLSGNSIVNVTELPASLEYLNLRKNKIVNLSPTMAQLQKLKTLNLCRNSIVDFEELPPNIEELYLSGNKIVDVPLCLGKLQKLKILTLDENVIVKFQELPPNLEELDLSENAIINLPFAVCKLQKLKTLILNKNPMVDFPELPVMPSLQVVEFINTNIPEAEDAMVGGRPEEEVMERLARMFPNATLKYFD